MPPGIGPAFIPVMEESAFDAAYALLVAELDENTELVEPEHDDLDDAWFDASEDMLAALPSVEDPPHRLAAFWASL